MAPRWRTNASRRVVVLLLQFRAHTPEGPMRVRSLVAIAALVITVALPGLPPPATSGQVERSPDGGGDRVETLVSRLDLERYKATIKALTQFGDRREGTARNR